MSMRNWVSIRNIEGLSTMPILRASKSCVCAGLFMVLALSGCAGTRLSPEAPQGVRLEGVWRLNRAASDDPQKIIDAMKAEALKRLRNMANTPPPVPMAGGPGGGRRQRAPSTDTDNTDQQQAQAALAQQGPGTDPLRNSPTMHALNDILRRSDYITIKQSPDQVSFDYGTTVRSYTPGGHSVVSSETGVADQRSGWDGKQYAINIRPQLGPVIVEEYGLSPDGKQLIVKSHIGPFELSKVNLTRVYDMASAVVPNARPSND